MNEPVEVEDIRKKRTRNRMHGHDLRNDGNNIDMKGSNIFCFSEVVVVVVVVCNALSLKNYNQNCCLIKTL